MKHPMMRCFLSVLSSLLLIMTLAACSSTSNSPKTATPAPLKLQAFSSNTSLYTIGYPQTWTVTQTDLSSALLDNRVMFKDPKTGSFFSVQVITDPNELVSAQGLVNNFPFGFVSHKQTTPGSPLTLAGEEWIQIIGTGQGDITQSGQNQNVAMKQVLLATTHPPQSSTTKLFTLYYSSDASNFDLMNTIAFQPMLKSFQFT